mgnify:CR=1 FL=1
MDASAFANAIHFNMDAEDLSSLMMSYAKASKLTYDNNLTTLGYADEADPISVKIFPRDFEAKERVLDHIDAYNKTGQSLWPTMNRQSRTPTTWASSWVR